MNREDIIRAAAEFVASTPLNVIKEEGEPELVLYSEPIAAVADARDPLFERFKNDPAIIGAHLMLPEQWLPGAKSVISIFLPASEQVRASNRGGGGPSYEWSRARAEGQQMINALTERLKELITAGGARCAAPSTDERFVSQMRSRLEGWPDYTSNWSERHAAFIAGHGTFGLSAGIITKKGMAGRFTSLITDLELEADGRGYEGRYDYCTRCGACFARCPAGAIDENGKKHPPCMEFQVSAKKADPRSAGCGKCQVGVPCEAGIPKRARGDSQGRRGISRGEIKRI